MDDELLSAFINESREHLTTIEADLLAIEEGGANVDTELVNKVFRAAHSIKGASGFFGLVKVKELAHKAETVLDMLRSKKMTPNAEITNVLLAAFDQLREMINHSTESADANIDELVVSLTGLASSYLPKEQKASLMQTVSLDPGGGARPVVLPKLFFEWAQDSGYNVYSVEYDLIHDIERQGLNVLDVFRELWAAGEIADCEVDFDAVGTLENPVGKQLPMRLVLATATKPADIGPLFPHNRDKVKLLAGPSKKALEVSAQQTGEPMQPPIAPPASPTPPAPPKNEVVEALFEYVTGTEFRHRVEAIVRNFIEMKEELDQEKRVSTRRWARREKQLSLIIDNTSGMYGELQALIGSQLKPIAALEFETAQSDDAEATVAVTADAD